MANLFLICICVFLLSFISSTKSFSIFVEPVQLADGHSQNGIFENFFRTFQQMLDDTEDGDSLQIPNSNSTSEDKRNVDDEPQSVFESDKTISLPNGGEKIEKLIEREYIDKTLSKRNVKREMTELYKFPNHTFKMVKKHGTNLTEREETKIDCIGSEDCNSTEYCLKDSYKCQSCHQEFHLCTESFQCCPGSICDGFEKICKRIIDKKKKSCNGESNCPVDHCCAFNNDGEAVCQPYLKEGEDCSKDPFEFLTEVNRKDTWKNLPNKCSCMPELACRRKVIFPFFASETCQKKISSEHKKKKDENQNSLKEIFDRLKHLHQGPELEKWRFHDNDEDLASFPIPSFTDVHTSFQRIVNNLKDKYALNTPPKTSGIPSTTTISPITKKPNKSIFEHKIRFNPAGSIEFHQPGINKGRSDIASVNSLFSSSDSEEMDKNDDSDDEDVYNDDLVKNELLDRINDDNDDSEDNGDDIDYFLKHPDNDQKNKNSVDNKQDEKTEKKLAVQINEKARQVTHKVVDGIFDNIMEGVIRSMKYQA